MMQTLLADAPGYSCHAVCVTLEHCTRKGGQHAEAGHLCILQDGVCAEVCDACSESCEGINDDARMQACFDACRRCAQECRQMSRMA